ncbi:MULTISPECIES: GH25 family lysozyme [unclassified Chelatococcus]|uniref:glycoside hydrolase family 25 protein n=1 Tax=unclassified Chelatococcus TaxID=2638111 RepID=UPI001BCA9EF6|nr:MULTISPECIES: GH25 family lysozyme [unclassified Chelatococcus]MBS7698220.1 glycoside hydrolase family 25 protein [Chelatococcus sp. YT9]MBX3559860.1 glycoside hydrolase family 25 protein [Chelatococcus sp.]
MLAFSSSTLRKALSVAVALVVSACAGPARDPVPEDYPIHGIDVSRWQGDIDWNAVRRGGVYFAWIKSTEGGDHKDPKFEENWYAAKAAGVPRGAYHFTYWCRPAREQVEWFKQVVPYDPEALPPVLDVEWNGHSKTCPKTIPRAQARAEMRIMLEEMERAYGKRPVIYTDITFFNDVIKDDFEAYPIWVRSIRRYPTSRFDHRNWWFWQYTAVGQVPGIKEKVDRNAFFGTASMWEKFLNGTL